jgi:hypothetical protein
MAVTFLKSLLDDVEHPGGLRQGRPAIMHVPRSWTDGGTIA